MFSFFQIQNNLPIGGLSCTREKKKNMQSTNHAPAQQETVDIFPFFFFFFEEYICPF